MASEIQTLRVEEFDAFMNYVERAFGHSRGFFQRVYPHMYQPTEEACSWAYVIKEGDEIVSHVGLYPIETVTAGVQLHVGGIGAVSTSPHARGKGYMTQLLTFIVGEMRRIGYPVSWLGGDRQRYNSFGWELASPCYHLIFSGRSLDWYKIPPHPLKEVFPAQAIDHVRRFSHIPTCHTLRPHLEQQMQKADLRYFIADDGYAVLEGQSRYEFSIIELVSTTSNEAGMIRSLLNWNYGEQALWDMSVWDTERLARLMPYVSYWRAGSSQMYRINHLTQLLTAAQTHLEHKAAAVKDFSVSLAIREHDRTTVTDIEYRQGTLAISDGAANSRAIELTPITAARLFLGGPAIPEAGLLPAELLALLPVPIYILPWDHV